VTVFGGSRADRLGSLGRVRVGPAGRYRFLARTGVAFRARATAPTRLDLVGPYCSFPEWFLAVIRAPCTVTTSGFTARSPIVRTR
jgi:hypothetical protein